MKTILIVIFVCLFMYSYAQPGTLDKSFGDTGIVINEQFTGSADAIGLLSNDKIIQAGLAYDKTTYLALTAYDTDGTIDESFGTDGVTYYKQLYEAKALSIDKDDNIFIASQISNNVVILKFKSSGILDNSLGVNGSSTVTLYNTVVTTGIIIQPDNKVVAGGYIINAENEPRDGFLIRYLPDGNLDKGFGDNGIVIFEGRSIYEPVAEVDDIALQDNGQILVSLILTSATVYRFNADGSRDLSFGDKGYAVFQSSDETVKGFGAYSLAIQPDGKIVGGGEAQKDLSGNKYMAAARLNADGSIDSSFGNNGIVHILFNKDYSKATKILLQADNKIILSGWAHDEFYTYLYLALTRLETDGVTDSTFGENGQTKTIIEGTAVSNDALLQKDGKIVLGGNTFIGDFTGKNYFVLARYNNDDKSKKQIIITKIKRWIQHHNGFTWDNNNNISSYVVQRSYDGIHFSSIAKVNASNTSNYTYADPLPLSGTNYYRLQTTSVNGVLNYSNVIAVTNDAIKISPNPAANKLRIEGLNAMMNYELLITNDKGISFIKTSVYNNNSCSINIQSLPHGMYYLQIKNGDDAVTKKFVKE